MSANLKSLIGRMNDTCRNALEGAAGLCLSRTNYDVDVEHLLVKLGETPDTDFHRILRRFEIDESRLAKDLVRSLDRLKTGNTRTPALSPRLPRLVEEAWLLGSIDFGASRVRSSHILLALLEKEEFARLAREISKEFAAISVETLRKSFADIVTGSVEDRDASSLGEAPAGDTAGGATGVPGRTKALDQYTVDLTARAKAGHIDPILGRDFEIRQVIDILTRRRQNNPILTGEAGVGKTAVVEGFALRIAQGDVPGPLKNVAVRTLDLGLLQAGAGIKGEFENRLKTVIEEVKASPQPIIVFIDEAHTMIGAGGQAGQNDAANLLKPALARGELRTIAATTWSEYKKFFEKDAALARRFQVVKIEEPSEDQCSIMLRGIVASLEKHHNLRLLDDAVTRTLDTLQVQQRILQREPAVGADHRERLAEIATLRDKTSTRLSGLRERWTKERDLVQKIREIRTQLEGLADPTVAVPQGEAATAQLAPPVPTKEALAALEHELQILQGEEPLMRVCVDTQTVSEVISAWTGIPVGKMVKDEIASVLELPSGLGQRVIGQLHALETIAQRIITSRASLDDPGKPVGVFLLVGPSGVGKTETALALSDLLYGGEKNLITINMSEFQEPHPVSTLKGSPPGYVGYGEGGVLTEAVRRRPYSVVLLDEVEKAHPDVLELFFQVFDKGQMEDGEGRQIDFKNTIIILTSNAGTDTIMKLTADPETMPSPAGLVKALKPELNKIFKPAFLGRLVIVPYYPVRDEALKLIVRLKLGKIQRRIQETHRIALTHDEELIEEVAKRCTEVESGARNVDNILTNTLLPEVSRQILGRLAERQKLAPIHVTIGDGGEFVYS